MLLTKDGIRLKNQFNYKCVNEHISKMHLVNRTILELHLEKLFEQIRLVLHDDVHLYTSRRIQNFTTETNGSCISHFASSGILKSLLKARISFLSPPPPS